MRRVAVAFIAIAFALTPQLVLAHAQLLSTDPAAGTIVQTAPARVTLVFSEPVTPASFGIKVYAPSGGQVASPVQSHAAVMSAGVAATEQGTYVVLWQVYAADTHPSRGAFEFSVGAASANPYSGLLDEASAGTSTPLGIALQAMSRWVHFIGFVLVFGLIAFAVLTRSGAPSRLVNVGLVLLVAAEPLALVAQLASLSFDSDTALAVLGSPFGRILGLRLGAALLAWSLIASQRSWPVLAVGAGMTVLDGFSAHAIPSVPLVGQLLVAVHVGAMGLWVGGLLGFVRSPDPRFVRYAAWTFSVAVVSGLVLAAVHTKLATEFLSSDYGRVLLLKAVVVGAAVFMAVIGRHRRELAIAALVLALATVLAALPPPF